MGVYRRPEVFNLREAGINSARRYRLPSLHGRNQQKWWKHRDAWARYDYFYQAENIRGLAGRSKDLADKSPRTKFYVLFNTHARGQAVANASMLHGALLPENRVHAPRTLIDALPDLRDFVAGASSDSLSSVNAQRKPSTAVGSCHKLLLRQILFGERRMAGAFALK
jgi:hypothetical protein